MIKEFNGSEDEYRGLQLPSYSLLKKIDDYGPKAILSKFKGGSETLDFGNLTDCLILQPEELNNKFYFESVEKPTNQLLQLADYIIEYCVKFEEPIEKYIKNTTDVLEFSNELNLFGNTKVEDKRIAIFDNNLFWNYLQSKSDAGDKTVFTPDTLLDANEAKEIIENSEKTSHLFKNEEGVEYINQLKLIGSIGGHDIKGMLDRVKIDHVNKVITPIDLKCTDVRMQSFRYIFFKLKYYLQASTYMNLIVDWAKELYPGYSVSEFKLIVYSRPDKYSYVWVVSDSIINDGFHGFTDYKGNKVKGVAELIDDYYYYVNNQQFNISREFLENNELYIL